MPRLRNAKLVLSVRTHTDFQDTLLHENGKMQKDLYVIPFMQIKQKAE